MNNAKLEIVGYHTYRRIRRRFLLGMRSDGHQRDHHHDRVWSGPAASAGCVASAFVVIGNYDHDYLDPEWRNTEAVDHNVFTLVKAD
jgi:hypothetical protein